MPKKRVSFGLNRYTTIVPELIGNEHAIYKYASATRGTLRRKHTNGEKKKLIELAHQNAKRCEKQEDAEGCMLLLGKMRYRDEPTFKQWEQTGLDAAREDRCEKGLPPLEEEETDVSDDDVRLARMQAEP
mgnify:FL=1|tara:strand:- start:151 stop:540 length:390 start_codon:yes stop_codon:yes gene_type:complete